MRLIERTVAADLTLKARNMSILRKVPRMHIIKKRMLIFVQWRRKIVIAARPTKQHKVNNGVMLYGFIIPRYWLLVASRSIAKLQALRAGQHGSFKKSQHGINWDSIYVPSTALYF